MKKTTCYVFLISLLFGSQAFAISVHQSKIADNDNNSSTANNGVDTENKQDDTINTKTGRRWDESYKLFKKRILISARLLALRVNHLSTQLG